MAGCSSTFRLVPAALWLCSLSACSSDDSEGAATTASTSDATSMGVGGATASSGGSGPLNTSGTTNTQSNGNVGATSSGEAGSGGSPNGSTQSSTSLGSTSAGGSTQSSTGVGGSTQSSSTTQGGSGTGTTGGPEPAPTGCETNPYEETEFTVFEVGPDHEYATPSEVPWESIGAGTLVKIHARPEPYRDKWVLNVAGSAEQPVVVRGVASNGQLPVITGDGALTRPELDFTNGARAIIKIGSSSVPNNDTPSHIRVECLDLVGARPGLSFSNDEGSSEEFAQNAAAIYIETGDHITVESCRLHEAGNGLFSAWMSSNVVVRGNAIFDNGNVDSIYEHNSYTEASGITFEFNHYGSLCEGCLGNNLKDRSAGTIVRYNWIENGNRQLDLVETGHAELANLSEYRATFVYGNVLVEGDGEGNSQVVHYGGDGDGDYRAGTLYFYHNTVVSTRSGNTTLARLSTDSESLDAKNNVFFTTAGGDRFALLDASGSAEFAGNFLPSGWLPSHSGVTGNLEQVDNHEAEAPGFVDLGAQNFSLLPTSEARGIAVPLPAAAASLPAAFQYAAPQSGSARAGTEDAGAFEGE